MGVMISGRWTTDEELSKLKHEDGHWIRPRSSIRHWVTADGSAGPSRARIAPIVAIVLAVVLGGLFVLSAMIAALLGRRWREVYEYALDHGYRFLSFGDAMFIESPVNHR